MQTSIPPGGQRCFSALQQPPKHPVSPQAQEADTNSGLQSIEDLTGMGFALLITAPYHQSETQTNKNQGFHYQHLHP